MGFFDFFIGMVLGGSQKAAVTKRPFLCPQCQQALSPAGQGLHACKTCQGMWLPNESFQECLRGEIEAESAATASSQHTYQRSNSSRFCAACEARMENYQFGYQSGIWIDACPDQHGVWLDAGELPLVLQFQQQSIGQEMSQDEKQRAAVAMLNGAVQAKSAFADVLRKEREEGERRRLLHGDYDSY